jgi:DNA-directed RNA polymerase subunit RPC12/RpoP
MNLLLGVRDERTKCVECGDLVSNEFIRVMAAFPCPHCKTSLAVKPWYRRSVSLISTFLGLATPWFLGVRGLTLVPMSVFMWLMFSAILQVAAVRIFPPKLCKSLTGPDRGERISLNINGKTGDIHDK